MIWKISPTLTAGVLRSPQADSSPPAGSGGRFDPAQRDRTISFAIIPSAHHNFRDEPRGSSRRAFVLGAAASLAMSVFTFGCGRRTEPIERVRRPGPPQTPSTEAAPQIALPERRPPLPRSEPIVRVRILQLRPGPPPADLSSDLDEPERRAEPIRIGEKGQRLRLIQSGPRPQIDIADGPVTVSMDERGWSIVDASFFRAPMTGTDPVEVHIDEPPSDSPAAIAIGERRYAGFLRLVGRTDAEPGAFDVVNHIALESYLPGVLARELFNHWHLQTHAAQAVAARSFACAEHAYFEKRRHFDMTSTQSSQAYVGAVTHRTSIEAVAMTRGLLLAEDDLVVPGYYSSCCGGVAARAIDGIGPSPINDTPALHGRSGPCVCDNAPVFQWQAERNMHEIVRRLNAFGRANNHRDLTNLVQIASIVEAGVNEHGRPTRYLISDIRDLHVALPAETLRRAVNYTGQGLHPPAPGTLVRSGNFTVTIDGNSILFRGRGFGHGAGMCQYGAEHLARKGREYREILEFYYPGAQIVYAYL